MDGLALANLKGIVAPLNFTAPMEEKPYSYNYAPGPGIALRNTTNEERTVTVYDARGLDLSLDREGFALVRHKTAASDLYDEAIIKSVYYPECEALMKRATGAKKVVAFDHIVRNAAKDNYRFESIVAGIVASPQFQMQTIPQSGATPPVKEASLQ